MTQYSIPSGDVSAGGWTATGGPSTLWECLDSASPPTPNDSDYVTGDSADTTLEVALSSVGDPLNNINHNIRIRAQAAGGGGAPERFDATLYEGGTLIATPFSNQSTNRGAFQDYDYSLTTIEADSISDYSDLRIRITVATLGAGETLLVSQAYLSVDDEPPPEVSEKFQKKNIFFGRN